MYVNIGGESELQEFNRMKGSELRWIKARNIVKVRKLFCIA